MHLVFHQKLIQIYRLLRQKRILIIINDKYHENVDNVQKIVIDDPNIRNKIKSIGIFPILNNDLADVDKLPRINPITKIM